MELFSEIYGCYYAVIADILRRAQEAGITRGEIDALVADKAFSESGLHLIPKLLSGEWDLLREEDGRYRSRLRHADTRLPLTSLQKAWLRALLLDRRIGLFLDREQIAALEERYGDVEPLFTPRDFHVFDAAADGDDYADPGYVRNFRAALCAIRERRPLLVAYEQARGGRMTLHVLPTRLLYSAKDDKFRLVGVQLRGKRSRPALLNMARISDLQPSNRELPEGVDLEGIAGPEPKRKVLLAIAGERNALERCMLQFASYDKQTSYDEGGGRHLCEIAYDPLEETELLIRVLSFGPVVEVLGPDGFLRQVRERVRMQVERMR